VADAASEPAVILAFLRFAPHVAAPVRSSDRVTATIASPPVQRDGTPPGVHDVELTPQDTVIPRSAVSVPRRRTVVAR
jgi:hypothetical protein